MAWNVVATLTLSSTPYGVAYGNGNVYVGNDGDLISVVDAATNAVTTITFSEACQNLVYNNGVIYIASQGGNNVLVVDAATNTVTTTITVGATPYAIAYGSNGYIYVANDGGNSVSVIDISTNAVTATVGVGSSPRDLVYAANGYVYVANEGSGTVSVIDAATNTVTTTITVGNYPTGIAYGNGYIYVADSAGGTLSGTVVVIDTTTNAVVSTITVGVNPFRIAYGNGYVCATNVVSGTVSVIDAATNTVTATITVGTDPFGLAFGVGYLYVANGSSATLSVISAASAPNAPSLTSPGNGSYIDATTDPSFTANNNSTDGANINARAMRLKASGATSYNYFNVLTGAFQSTIIWNAVNYAPGAAGTFGPISGLSNGITDNWSMADQEGLANLQGPFASDFTVNMQAAPNLSINSPVGSMTTSSSPSLSYSATPPSGAQVTGGQWLIYTLAATQVSGFTIDIATATIPAGAVSNVTFTGNPLTIGMQSGVSLSNSVTYVAYAAVTETGGEWSNTSSSTFTISLDQPAIPTITAVDGTDPVTGCPLIALTVQGHDNLLSADDASFEGSIGTWTNGPNWTIPQSTTYALDGSHSLECSRINTTQGSGYAQSGYYSASPSMPYTALIAVYCDSTSEGKGYLVKVLDNASNVWSTTLTTALGWNYFVLSLTTNAATTELRLLIADDPQSAPASGQNIWLDECGIFPGTITTWTRGGLAGSTQAIITRSDGVQVRNVSIANPLSIPSPSQLVTINDYEVFPTISYTYTAQIQDVLSSTATITSPVSAPTTPAVTISTTSWWLFDPTDPSTAVSANPTQWQPVNTEQSAAHMVTGQQTLLIVANEMMHQDFNATFEIFNSNTYSLLQALLKSQKTIFISSPFGAEDTGYFRIGPQTGGMSSGMGNKTKNTTLLASTSAAPHRTIQITAVAQNRPNV